jgi:hypothetical protein
MSMKECKEIRREIDQTTFADQPSTKVREHLRGCADCTRFESEQRTLQSIMANLGTVAAPADFDFRLRARLAREKSVAGNGHGFASFLRLPRPLAAAALVLLLVVGGIVLKNWIANRNGAVMVAGGTKSTGQPNQTANPGTEIGQEISVPNDSRQAVAVGRRDIEQHIGKGPRALTLGTRKIESRATRDTALSPAELLTNQSEMTDGIVKVPLEDQGLRISIDDGRGSRRMISIPTFSFGSQKLTGQSFVPVSAPKGVW